MTLANGQYRMQRWASVLRLVLVLFVFSQSIENEKPQYLPVPARAEPLKDLLPQRGLLRPGQQLLEVNSQYRKKEHRVNLETREVEIAEYVKLDGGGEIPLGSAYYPELDRYSLDMSHLALQKAWISSLVGQNDARSGGGLDNNLAWELPVKVPDWLRRLGADQPKLQINGSFKVIVEGSATRGMPSKKDSWFPSFNLDNEPSFSVTGSIGRLIHIEINSEQGFGTNIRDQLKISYHGEGDELEDNIIQEISLGNISLELPKTQLTGYSEEHKGLFGVKTHLKFGDLHVTSILSQEGGAHESQNLNLGEEEIEVTLDDRNPDLYKHFFLSLKDRQEYADPRDGYGVGSSNYIVGGKGRGKIKVYTLRTVSSKENVTLDPVRTAYAFDIDGHKIDRLQEKGYWKEFPSDSGYYTYNEDLRLLTVSRGHEGMAIAIDPIGASNSKGDLVLIKQSHASQDSLLDKLMWRHVYSIGKVEPDLRNRFKLSVQDMQKNKSLNGKSFVTLLGLTAPDKPNELDLGQQDIFDFENGYLILPCRVLDSGKVPDASQCLTPLKRINPNTQIYDLPSDQIRDRANTTHQFSIFSKQKQSTFDVTKTSYGVSGGSGCLDITPGTERLMLGSKELRRNIDYEVLYEVGQITLISPLAKAPGADVSISYECTPAFQIQDKWLMGTRLQYNLDAISDESMMGATVLFKSQTSREKRPQLEREPFHQFLWGFNTSLTGTPQWMTKIVNKLPLINTKAESRVRWDFEIAQSYYNPNTKGSALVDDFENSKRDFTFPVYISSWKQASPPGGTEVEPWYDAGLDYRHAGKFIWHSNLVEDFGSIYGASDYVNTNKQEVRLLSFKLTPNDNFRGNSWGGVMRGLSGSLRNQSRKRFLEVVVRGGDGSFGIDLGKISEDLSIAGEAPDKNLNTEVEYGAYINENDYGLDGKEDAEETGREWQCKPTCISRNLSIATSTDPAGDGVGGKWEDPKDGVTNPSSNINATEGNNAKSSGFGYDTEDLNQNNVLDTKNQFARYTIDFSTGCTDQTNCEELVNGWRKYRIPLYEEKNYKLYGDEGLTITDILSSVNHTRLWYGRLSPGVSQSEMYLARVSMVGNDWEEASRNRDFEISPPPLLTTDSLTIRPPTETPDTNNLRVLVINNREEKNNYTSSPNTTIEKDTETDEPVQEQSLLLKYENLHPGEQVYATRLFTGQMRDFTEYGRLLLEMHPEASGTSSQNDLDFVMQFGRDNGNEQSDNYYEIRLPLDKNLDRNTDAATLWKRHAIDVNLGELAALKNDTSWLQLRKVSRTVYNKAREDSSLSIGVVGDPSLSQINWMRLSLAVHPTAIDRQSGEIWVNDLRLEGVNKAWGTAVRASFQSEFADFVTVSGNTSINHGNFNSFTSERKSPALSKTTLEYSSLISVFANKFLPDEWGVQIPLSLNYLGTIERPFTKPSSDIPLSSTGILNVAEDLFSQELDTQDSASDLNERNSRAYQTRSQKETFSTSYRKERRSKSFLTQTLAERPSFEFVFNENELHGPKQSDSTRNYKTLMQYDLSPYEPKTYRPLGFIKNWILVPKFIKDFEFSPYPEQMNVTTFNLFYQRSHNISFSGSDATDNGADYQVDLSHGFRFNWKTFNFLAFNYSIEISRDFDKWYEDFGSEDFFSTNSGHGLFASDIVFSGHDKKVNANGDTTDVTYGFLMAEATRKQSFDIDFTPQLFNWLPLPFRSTTQYTHNRREEVLSRNNGTDYIPEHYEASLEHTLSLTPTLQLSTLFYDLEEASKPIASLNKVFKSTREHMDTWRLRSVGAGYSINHRLQGEQFSFQRLYESNISTGELLAYQFGMLYSPQTLYSPSRFWDEMAMGRIYDNGEVDQFDVYEAPLFENNQTPLSHGITRDANLNTGLTVPGLDLTLNTRLDWSQSFTVRRDSITPYGDTSLTWPRMTLSGTFNNLMKQLPGIETVFRSFSLSTGYEYKVDQRYGIFSSNNQSRTISHALRPLVKIAGTTPRNHRWESDVDLTYSVGRETPKIQDSTRGARTFRLTSDQIRAYVPRANGREYSDLKTYGTKYRLQWSYDLETQKGLQVWRWYWKLENNLRLKWVNDIDYKRQKRYETTPSPSDSLATITQMDNKSHTLSLTTQPDVTYSFTRKVDAGAFIKLLRTQEFHTKEEEVTWDILVHGEITMRF